VLSRSKAGVRRGDIEERASVRDDDDDDGVNHMHKSIGLTCILKIMVVGLLLYSYAIIIATREREGYGVNPCIVLSFSLSHFFVAQLRLTLL